MGCWGSPLRRLVGKILIEHCARILLQLMIYYADKSDEIIVLVDSSVDIQRSWKIQELR